VFTVVDNLLSYDIDDSQSVCVWYFHVLTIKIKCQEFFFKLRLHSFLGTRPSTWWHRSCNVWACVRMSAIKRVCVCMLMCVRVSMCVSVCTQAHLSMP